MRRRRINAGLTQTQAAQHFTAAGYPIKLAAYSQIEAGNTRITVDMLTVAAEVFECSPTSLMIPTKSDETSTIEYQGPGATRASNALRWLLMEEPFRADNTTDIPRAALARWQIGNFPTFAVPPIMQDSPDQP
jgi:transcriptional regulator with XRE-family HTH domain